jgi:hypothetical protein
MKCCNWEENRIHEEESGHPPSSMSSSFRDTAIYFYSRIDIPEWDKKSKNPPIGKSSNFYQIKNTQKWDPSEPTILDIEFFRKEILYVTKKHIQKEIEKNNKDFHKKEVKYKSILTVQYISFSVKYKRI